MYIHTSPDFPLFSVRLVFGYLSMEDCVLHAASSEGPAGNSTSHLFALNCSAKCRDFRFLVKQGCNSAGARTVLTKPVLLRKLSFSSAPQFEM